MSTLEALLREGSLISAAHLDGAVAEAQATGQHLVAVLVKRRWIDEAMLAESIARQTRLPRLDLRMARVDTGSAMSVEPEWGQTHRVAPLWRDPSRGILHVAMCDPTDQLRIEELSRRTNLRVEAHVATDSEVQALLNHQHRREPLQRDTARINKRSAISTSQPALHPVSTDLEQLRPLFEQQEASAKQLRILFEYCVAQGLIDPQEYMRRLAAASDH